MNRLGLSGLLFLGLFVSACMDNANAGLWPEHRGNMSGVSGPAVNSQNFTAGAGTYTWIKPANATFCWVQVWSAGCGGGSGGAGTSDSGGGSGATGGMISHFLLASSLNTTESIVIAAGGTGATGVSGNTNGNQGGSVNETSFGAAARNLVRIQPVATCGGFGGDNNVGNGGTASTFANYQVLIAGGNTFLGLGGAIGDDTVAGATATAQGQNNIPLYATTRETAGGGGGGTNGGANFTAGGAGGLEQITAGVTLRNGAVGGAADGAAGANGAAGGEAIVSLNSIITRAGGLGGGGGAGAVVALANGGKGGNGGNCGGSGGGGGSSLTGTSGVGGDGGAGCVFVDCL